MIPTPFVLQVKPFLPGAADTHGNVEDSWGTPVPLKVHAIAPGAMVEPNVQGRDMSLVLYTLYCPAGVKVSEYDRVTMGGNDYVVDGRPMDYTQGPWFNTVAGIAVHLKNVEG